MTDSRSESQRKSTQWWALRLLLRALPLGALARLADFFLTAAHERSRRSSVPHLALLQTCATELLRTAAALSYAPLVRALVAAAETFPPRIQVRALEALRVATRDSAFQRRRETFAEAAPLLVHVHFEVKEDLPISDRQARKMMSYLLFNTRGQQLAILDQDLIELGTNPRERHLLLLDGLRTLTGSPLPNLDAVETWIDTLCALCFAHYDIRNDTELTLRDFKGPES
ncbi:MAG: hypothetical protein ACJ8R9_05415 [Steroidobacteraceae bacterium]